MIVRKRNDVRFYMILRRGDDDEIRQLIWILILFQVEDID